MLIDTSVAVPALVVQHPMHEECRQLLRKHAPALPGHAWVETFAVLTRMPLGPSGAADAFKMLTHHLPEVVWPTTASLEGFLSRCTAASIRGGAVYDALVALAVPSGEVLVSRDRRAARTYRAMGVDAATPQDVMS